ncbi:MAG: CotH kinase family protein [Bacteroidales bacterium]|nr:CotH kinase family protein [Bacteroidales bacterium]MCD8393550.1 CotH kinase family protein [Bacteroidales bacterium]
MNRIALTLLALVAALQSWAYCIYYDDTASWGAVYAYYWWGSNTGTFSNALDQDSSTGLYKWEPLSAPDYVIFTNKGEWNSTSQTCDFYFVDGAVYNFVSNSGVEGKQNPPYSSLSAWQGNDQTEDVISYDIWGTLTSSTWSNYALTESNSLWVSTGLAVTNSGAQFGIRVLKNGTQINNGWYGKGTLTIAGTASSSVTNGDSNLVIATGTYDFSFDPSSATLTVNTAGSSGGGGDDDDDDPVVPTTSVYFWYNCGNDHWGGQPIYADANGKYTKTVYWGGYGTYYFIWASQGFNDNWSGVYRPQNNDTSTNNAGTYTFNGSGGCFNITDAGIYTITYNGSSMTVTKESISALPDFNEPSEWITGTLPVMYINVYTDATKAALNSSAIDKDLQGKDYFKYADYYLVVPDGLDTKFTNVGSATSPLALQIKPRGNYTRTGFSKKPFKLKLDKKQNFGSMNINGEKSKHWALLNQSDDYLGFLRNFVGFNLGEKMGLPWTPRIEPIEVVINGNYRGLYFLTESIRVGDGRVDIQELDDEVTDCNLVSGGYLIELDNYKDDTTIAINTGDTGDDLVWVTPDTPEIYSSVQTQFVTDQFSTMHSLVKSKSTTLWSYMDLDDAARYYIIEEILGHWESYHGSTYMFRDRGTDQKWHFSPLWDHGNAFASTYNKYFYDCDTYGNTWITDMVNMSTFMAKVKPSFLWFMQKQYGDLVSEMSAFATKIQTAAEVDAKRWNGQPLPVQYNDPLNNYTATNPTAVADNSDVLGDLATVTDYLSNRLSWLRTQWGDYTTGDYSEPERDTTAAATLPDYATPETYAYISYTLPVVAINFPSGDLSQVAYGKTTEGVTVIFDDVTKEGHTPLTVASSEIKGRGSDFATATKRSYKLKLGTKEKPFSLNEKKSKHFTLIPYEQDAAYGLLSNYAGHRIAEAIGMEWAPAMMPVELVVNGTYYGLYFLGENIRVADDRLNIADDETTGYKAGDTWIWEVDVNGSSDAYGYSWANDNTHWVVSQMPELGDYSSDTPDEIPSGKVITWNEINAAIPTAITALSNAAKNASEYMYNYDWQTTIDMEQAAMFMIVNELMDCKDAYETNFYMWYDGTWKLGPVWGFNNSFASGDAGKSLLTIDRTDYNGVLLQNLYSNAWFRSRLTTLFQYFIHDFSEDTADDDSAATARRPKASTTGVDATSELATILNEVVALAKTMETAATYDAVKWPTVASTSDGNTVTDRANSLAAAVKANALWLETDPGTDGTEGAGWNWDTLKETTGIDDVLQDSTDSDAPVHYYDVMGRQLPSAPSTGVYIEQRGDKASIKY